MKKQAMEWNKKIKDQLQDIEVAPPDECWNNIAAEMKKSKVTSLQSPYAKSITWLKYGAAAAVAGIFMFSVINEPFRNAMQDAMFGKGTKASVIDSTPSPITDSIALKDSAH